MDVCFSSSVDFCQGVKKLKCWWETSIIGTFGMDLAQKDPGQPLSFDGVPEAGLAPRLCNPAVKHPGPKILQQPAAGWSQLQLE